MMVQIPMNTPKGGNRESIFSNLLGTGQKVRPEKENDGKRFGCGSKSGD